MTCHRHSITNRLLMLIGIPVVFAIPTTVGAEEIKLKGAVYSPSSGVICDRKAKFCADSEGISLSLTRQYLGAAAEKTMLGRIKSAEQSGSSYDLTWFGLSNGVDCKTQLKRCTVSKHSNQVDAAHTRALFGR